MNKKIIVLVVLLLIAAVVIGILIDHHLKEKRERCDSISGGAFHLVFETNGGEELRTMHVGIAVSPDSYDVLPVPSKEGFDFEGWYYDKELTKKVDATSSRDISPVPNYYKNKCLIGYKDITLYAKWVKK